MQLDLQSSADLTTQMPCWEVWEKWTWFGCNVSKIELLVVWSLGLRLKITLPLCYVTCTGYRLVQELTLSSACTCTRHWKKTALIYISDALSLFEAPCPVRSDRQTTSLTLTTGVCKACTKWRGCEHHEYSLWRHRLTDCGMEVTLTSDCLASRSWAGKRGVLNT